ncbi:MAG: hypothetical protein EP338_11965 [Bacteroidetes bacterium]|nr:MAG: hypothetical protein EP338_11965 [Bacteroidota bacterium]
MKFCFFFCLLFLSSGLLAQGLIDGFFKGKGNLDLAVSASYQQAKQYYAGRNLINLERNIQANSIYAAYGLHPKIDVVANIPVINGQLQDFGFMGKFALLNLNIKQGKFTAFAGIGGSFPLSNYRTETSQAVGQRAIQIIPRLGFQWMLGNGFFIQSQSGYNYSLDPVPSSFPFSVKLGLAQSNWYYDAWFDFQEGDGNADYQGSVPFTTFRELVTSYQRVGGTIYRGIGPRWGVFLNGSYTLSGRNTGKAWSAGLGAVIKFSKKTESND